jgi:hypothetical protein
MSKDDNKMKVKAVSGSIETNIAEMHEGAISAYLDSQEVQTALNNVTRKLELTIALIRRARKCGETYRAKLFEAAQEWLLEANSNVHDERWYDHAK